MGFGAEGSLVLKHENRKRISNKEFQVHFNWLTSFLLTNIFRNWSKKQRRVEREDQ